MLCKTTLTPNPWPAPFHRALPQGEGGHYLEHLIREDLPAAVGLLTGGAVGLLSPAAHGDLVLEFATVATGCSRALAGGGDRSAGVAVLPDDGFTDRCRGCPGSG